MVVRYRLGAGGPDDWRADSGPNPSFTRAPSLSDITGFLRAADAELIVVERDGQLEQIPTAAITSLRQLSARAVRNSEVRVVERQLTEAAGGEEMATIDGWAVSAAPNAAPNHANPRANAAVPLDFGASTAALDLIRAWYAARGLPAHLVVAARLLPGAQSLGAETEYEVLTDADGAAAEVLATDTEARLRLRAKGFALHHTTLAIDLPTA